MMPEPASAIDGKLYLKEGKELVDRLLDKHLPSENMEPKSLHEAMRYSIFAGGKRIRPILALAAYEYCQGEKDKAADTIHKGMASLEMVHTYSLIHDDLPCMDDDDLRRGIPTCHKKFGEALAVLAGDALHVVAFRLMAETGSAEAVIELAEAVGTMGMLGGQIADIEAEGKISSHSEVKNIHSRKTGALIKSSVRIGAILAGADQVTMSRLTTYGENIGLAFQIIDDILDVEGSAELIGKQTGADSKKNKATYPSAIGVEKARKEADQLIDNALSVFEDYDDNILRYIGRYVGKRVS